MSKPTEKEAARIQSAGASNPGSKTAETNFAARAQSAAAKGGEKSGEKGGSAR